MTTPHKNNKAKKYIKIIILLIFLAKKSINP